MAHITGINALAHGPFLKRSMGYIGRAGGGMINKLNLDRIIVFSCRELFEVFTYLLLFTYVVVVFTYVVGVFTYVSSFQLRSSSENDKALY